MNNDTWASWFRQSSDKLILLLALVVMLVMHSSIHNDPGQIQFFEGLSHDFTGALIALVTSAVLHGTDKPPPKGTEPQ